MLEEFQNCLQFWNIESNGSDSIRAAIWSSLITAVFCVLHKAIENVLNQSYSIFFENLYKKYNLTLSRLKCMRLWKAKGTMLVNYILCKQATFYNDAFQS